MLIYNSLKNFERIIKCTVSIFRDQTRLRILRNSNPGIIDLDYRERRVIFGDLHIDYNCFMKTKAEKLRLKVAKAQAKLDE